MFCHGQTRLLIARFSTNCFARLNNGGWGGATTLSIMTFGITTFGITTISIMGLFTTPSIYHTQQNDTKHNGLICDTWHYDTQHKIIECHYAEWQYAECHCAGCLYDECHYTECRIC